MGNNFTQVQHSPAGFACKTDSDCFVGFTDGEGIITEATTIADKAKRCCQYVELSNGLGDTSKT